MDRWYWASSNLVSDEFHRYSASGIRLYDGDKKTVFDNGHITLTSMRIIWNGTSNTAQSLSLNLQLVILVEEEPGSFTSSPKVVLHLSSPPPLQPSGPVNSSDFTYIKLCFRHSGMKNFLQILHAVLKEKAWEQSTKSHLPGVKPKQLHAGILGIERNIQAKQNEAAQTISHAFEDMKNLMSLAKDMVILSKSITNKIKEQAGEISSDETLQLRSYLLSLGIDDPVTKEAVGSTTEYHKRLSEEICNLVKSAVKEVGGVMLLSEVYCRINRARGLQLVSPEDVQNACTLMHSLGLSLCLRTFQSGVKVLQLTSLDEKEVADKIRNILLDNKVHGVSAPEFAQVSGIPLLLAQERLHDAERCATAVRDESTEGLRFYPNLFFTESQI